MKKFLFSDMLLIEEGHDNTVNMTSESAFDLKPNQRLG